MEGSGPKASERVLDILLLLAQQSKPQSLRQLTELLSLPRASLHRLLKSLEVAGYLDQSNGEYSLGAQSYHLARLIGEESEHMSFPGCARPTLEWLARESGETVILGMLSEQRREIVYADVIVAESPLQYAVPAGDRRPLYSSATGKCVLAFMSVEETERYIANTDFIAITPQTTRREDIEAILETVRATGVMQDRDGHFVGAGAVASPICRASGEVFAAIVVAGPNERIDSSPVDVADIVHEGGRRISRIMGYEGRYPPARQG